MIAVENVNFTYTASEKGCLKNINLQVKKGEFVVLCGRSGCGKTTLTRVLNGLIPHFYEGKFEGAVKVSGLNISEADLSKTADLIGSVFQNPSSQFFHIDTDGELSFGCENLAMEPEKIRRNVKKSVEDLELNELTGRTIFELSGGEKQQIACGSVYATEPEVYVLDEPSSNLDAKAILRLKSILGRLKKTGKTVIISEHRLYYLMELTDRFLYMEEGEIIHSYNALEMKGLSGEKRRRLGLRAPFLNRVSLTADPYEGEPDVMEIIKLTYRRKKEEVLNIEYLSIPNHAVVAIVGENGAGKTTFAECVSGLLKCRGQINIKGHLCKQKRRVKNSYIVMQDVNRQLFCESVLEEIALGVSERQKQGVDTLLHQMDLVPLKERHPASLSGGQKQRVSICSAICAEKQWMFYDEPTSGLDFDGMCRFCTLVQENREHALVSWVITHDLELIMGSCTHVLHLEHGRVKEFYCLNKENINRIRQTFGVEDRCL